MPMSFNRNRPYPVPPPVAGQGSSHASCTSLHLHVPCGRLGWGKNRARKFLIFAATLLISLCTALSIRYWPREPLAARISSSTAIFDSRGQLLRLTLAKDQQYRLWTPLNAMPPQVVDALLLHEDQYFYKHLGVNPVAVARATVATYVGGSRQGGSTLTMQLARSLYGLNTRTLGGKLKQMLLAIGLELRYSKHDLLEAHLNTMPYGGNLQGVRTASLVYFGKDVARLALSETLTLVVIPQSPARRNPEATEPESLRAARRRLFARWLQTHPSDAGEAELIDAPLRYAALQRLPFTAPHFTALLLERNQAGKQAVRTTLNAPLQRLSEQVLQGYVREQSRIGVRNAALLLVDYRDMAVQAMVGSADFFGADIAGQVNGTLAKRSPGSALKPFVYGLAIDQGLIHPLTVLKDGPTNFGGFSPENFDGRFAGPVTATEALTRSRNVPAVTLAAQLAEPSFYQFLRTAGISKLAAESHYGLSLTLGGGEVTMEETAMLYAMLANRGKLAPLRYEVDDAHDAGTRLLSAEASYMVLDMLASAPRPDGNNWVAGASQTPRAPVAWKTGTSWGFRDAWTVGVFGPYVLAVWVGNFDGSGNPAFVGVQAAAPLFFRMVDAIEARNPHLPAPFAATPERLVRVEVCNASGDLPNADCPRTGSTWYIPGVSPIKVSQIHKRLWIDTRTGKQACAPYHAAHTRSEVFEFWPSDLQRLFAQAGMPRRNPPTATDCSQAAQLGTPPRITSPATNVTYALTMEQAERDTVPLLASTDGDVRRVHWFVDATYVGSGKATEAVAWHATRSGRHIVRAIDDQGRADSRELNVSFAQ
jgi:penicillin-binding protein 1C